MTRAATARATMIVVLTALLGTISAGAARAEPNPIKRITLPLKFPAVGNLDAVRQWRFGRLEQVIRTAGDPDIVMQVRTLDGSIVRVVGPLAQLRELARQSNWIRPPKRTASREDYVERMVAFDVDDSGRLIAAASLEPMYRDRNRLRRALGR